MSDHAKLMKKAGHQITMTSMTPANSPEQLQLTRYTQPTNCTRTHKVMVLMLNTCRLVGAGIRHGSNQPRHAET